jgi:hypothetical protein
LLCGTAQLFQDVQRRELRTSVQAACNLGSAVRVSSAHDATPMCGEFGKAAAAVLPSAKCPVKEADSANPESKSMYPGPTRPEVYTNPIFRSNQGCHPVNTPSYPGDLDIKSFQTLGFLVSVEADLSGYMVAALPWFDRATDGNLCLMRTTYRGCPGRKQYGGVLELCALETSWFCTIHKTMQKFARPPMLLSNSGASAIAEAVAVEQPAAPAPAPQSMAAPSSRTAPAWGERRARDDLPRTVAQRAVAAAHPAAPAPSPQSRAAPKRRSAPARCERRARDDLPRAVAQRAVTAAQPAAPAPASQSRAAPKSRPAPARCERQPRDGLPRDDLPHATRSRRPTSRTRPHQGRSRSNSPRGRTSRTRQPATNRTRQPTGHCRGRSRSTRRPTSRTRQRTALRAGADPDPHKDRQAGRGSRPPMVLRAGAGPDRHGDLQAGRGSRPPMVLRAGTGPDRHGDVQASRGKCFDCVRVA